MIISNLDFIIIAIILLSMVIYKTRKLEEGENGLSYENSCAIKGISAILIVLHHLTYKLNRTTLNYKVFNKIGFIPVAIFFFFSGYGLMKNFIKDKNYLKGFLKNRTIKLLIPFIATNIIYIAVNILLGEQYNLIQTIKYIFGIKLINEYAWYVVSVFVLYIAFYISFKFFDKKSGIAVITAFTILHMIVNMYKYTIFKPWLFGSTLSFLIGIYFANAEEKIVKLINKKYIINLIISIVLFLIALKFSVDITMNTILYKPFVLIFLGVSYTILNIIVFQKIKIKNKLTIFLGSISYELYLIHKLVIDLTYKYIGVTNKYIYITVCLLVSIFLAYILNLVFKKVRKKNVKI